MEKTASGLLVPTGTIEQTDNATYALERYYAGMAKLESNFPQLVKMAVAVAGQIEKHAQEKGIAPEGVYLDAARWHPDGTVTIAVELNPEAQRATTTDQAAQNFNTLKQVNEKYPQAVELAMSLAFQLVGVINSKKLMPSEITCSKPIWHADNALISFKMGANGQALTPPLSVKI